MAENHPLTEAERLAALTGPHSPTITKGRLDYITPVNTYWEFYRLSLLPPGYLSIFVFRRDLDLDLHVKIWAVSSRI